MLDTIKQAIAYGASSLTESDSAKLDAELLLLKALGKDNRSYLFTWPDNQLTPAQQTQFQALLQRRVNGEPIAYILGIKEFWGLPLKVQPSTLIPRPDTETLVEVALEKASLFAELCSPKLLDLGTGTGAIALALQSELPNWQVDAVEYNADAFLLAQANASVLSLGINLFQGSWFSPLTDNQKYQIIVSNPPYIEENDPHLIQGDVRFEPRTALTSGKDGLDDIRLIIEQSRDYLAAGGYLILEHGYNQAAQVKRIFLSFGFVDTKTVQDLNGMDRITLAQFTA